MPKPKEKIKAIIFDLDGTVLDSEYLWENATLETLSNHGINISKENYSEKFAGVSAQKCWEELKQTFNLNEPIEKLIEECRQIVIANFNKNPQFIKGFENFHSKLNAQAIPSCIATNCDDLSLNDYNKTVNLNKYFGENIFGISQVNNKAKPNPDIFLYAAQKLNVKPSECIVFEDSSAGFNAAKAAGMKCIAIKSAHNQNSRHLANETINDYDEAIKKLKSFINLKK